MFRVALLFVIFWVEFVLVLQMTTHTVKQDLAQIDNIASKDGWVFAWKKIKIHEGEKKKKKIMKNEWPKKKEKL